MRDQVLPLRPEPGQFIHGTGSLSILTPFQDIEERHDLSATKPDVVAKLAKQLDLNRQGAYQTGDDK